MEKSAPNGYFDKVVELMVRAGFALISRVSIDSNEVKFHVPAGYARCTSLFFHKPGRKLIAHLKFSENDCYRDFFYGSWSIDFDAEFLPMKKLFPLIQIPDDPERWWDDIRYKTVPGMDEALHFEGFTNYGRDWQEDPPKPDRLAPMKLVEQVRVQTDRMMPYLDRGQFGELQVTNYPPAYVFPRCEELFWKKFDRAYFRNVVRRPWGSSEGIHRIRRA